MTEISAKNAGSQYTHIAAFYDRLNKGANYKKTADYIESIFSMRGAKPELVLDLACGTGSLTLELDKRGYDMTGVDISAEMLNEAVKKKRVKKEGGILWIKQDMRELDLFGTVDAAICCFDGINYLTDPDDIGRVFAKVYNFLNCGGVFIFDVNSSYKFENVYAKNTFFINSGDLYCVWRNFYNKKNRLCEFRLTFFCGDGMGGYRKFEETQTERCYSAEFLNEKLSDCGFKNIECRADFQLDREVSQKTERICFFAEK